MIYTTLVHSEVLWQHLGEVGWAIVDCRFRLEAPDAGRALYEAAHIPGAVYADLNHDLSQPPGGDAGRHPLPDLDTFQATLGRWGIGQGVQVVAYDDAGGAMAARLWWLLRYLGHEAVAVLDGGWDGWLAAGYPTAQGWEQRAPARFAATPQPNRLASLEEVAERSARGAGSTLIDAREPARYRGEYEPIDAVAGHIPGARNFPFRQNLNAEGTLRPTGELRQRWESFLGDQQPSEMIVYCGSGVTACHNLLALEHVGLGGARLFVASWSGWSADPARPVERESNEEG